MQEALWRVKNEALIRKGAKPVRPLRYRLESSFVLPRAEAWEMLSDTDHLNRVIGLFAVSPGAPGYEGGSFSRTMEARAMGFLPLRWQEYPFDWEQGRQYTVLREYRDGPLVHMIGQVDLLDEPDGTTRVALTSEFLPRSLLGVLAARFEGLRRMQLTMRFLETAARLRSQGRARAVPQLRQEFAVERAAMEQALKALARRPIQTALIGLLRENLLTQGDDEVVGMGPFRLAARWGSDPVETLRLFLYAARDGVLTLHWNLLCPACRVPTDGAASLTDLHTTGHCDLCAVDYQGDFDRFVELTFDVHPAIRKASRTVYCVSGPALSPHIIRQRYLRPGAGASFPLPPEPEEVRFRVLRFNHELGVTDGPEGATATRLECSSQSGWSAALLRRPGPEENVTVVNTGTLDLVVVLERLQWDPLAVTAARVTAMQEFRDLFSSEVLAPGQEVSVANVTLLFSDLQGSTAMYEMAGDAPAYGKVRRHFDFMIEWISANSGSLVKTIGDAVMAVFFTPEGGVRAALEIQRHLDQFNAGLPPGTPPLVIKMGLHHGPAIAINANERLDYFGRTVNIAARIQRESKGHDLVLSSETHERPDVQAVLSSFGVRTEAYLADLRGIEGRVGAVRVTLPSESGPVAPL